jgi:serine/threonine-protein kinase RsbW
MDRLDDAMLICDALSAHAPEHAHDGHLSFALNAEGDGFELRLGELAEHAGVKVVRDSVLPGVGNVLERMTDELSIVPAADGRHEELVLKLRF